MKKFLFLLFCFFSSLLTASDYQIVFVHLGPKLPIFTPISISQARLFNPEANIILVANEEAINRRDFPLDDCSDVLVEKLQKSSAHERFCRISKLDKSFRNGFWHYATERLLYLDDLMKQLDLTNVFHLETDNMLYADLSELLPVFQNSYNGIAAPYESDERGFASFIYIKNQESIHKLSQHLANQAHFGKNEMIQLHIFKERYGSKYIDHLPVIMTEYTDYYPLITPMGRKPNDESKNWTYSKNFSLFQSMFDGCSYGQYLGGIDPNNGPSSPGFINESSFFNCSHMEIEWREDAQGRRIPYAGIHGQKYRINNLHIHAKNLENFKSR